MEDITLLTKIQGLLNSNLIINSPVMSGNMQSRIMSRKKDNRTFEIEITAPNYDIAHWQKTDQIVIIGDYDYAASVNALGAFGGRSTKSKHWVNKTVINTIKTISALYVNTEVIIKIEE